MARGQYATAILAGTMLLLVWHISLPYDKTMLDTLHGQPTWPAAGSDGLRGLTEVAARKNAPGK